MSLTEMVLMPGADYKAACDAIREKTETTDLIKSGQMADAIRSIAAGDTSKLYVGQVIGDGTSGISFDVPFAPDYVSVLPTDPLAQTRDGTVGKFIWFYRDFKTFGRQGGLEQHYDASVKDYKFNTFTNKSIESYIKYKNGKVTFNPPPVLSKMVWLKDFTFTVVALKYVPDDVTDRALLEQYIDSLPASGGSLTISARRLGETGMTEAEFKAYVQRVNPNWTITLE